MRILFAGTPEIAVPSLVAAAAEHTVVAVLTNPDRPAGRGRLMCQSAVKEASLRLGLNVLQPEKLDAGARKAICSLEPELLVVFACGWIFGPRFLECFPRGGINIHPSLLPRHRGPCPIPAAILAGDAETGITVQSLALKMDAGDIILQESFPLNGKETTGSLMETAAEKGAALLVKALGLIASGGETRVPQEDAAASYCGLIAKEHARIDWTCPASRIERMVRAFDPWPGAWTMFGKATLRILAAEALPSNGDSHPPGQVLGVDTQRGILIQTGEGLLAVSKLQLQAKKAMDFASFINGVRGFAGSVLGDQS